MLAATDGYNTIHFGDATSGAGRYAGYVQYNHTDDRLFLGAGSATKVTIDSLGRVGIGISGNALTGLELKGDANDTDIMTFTYTGTTGGHESGIAFRDKRDQINAAFVNNLINDGPGTHQAHLELRTANAGSLTTKMKIFGNGNVEINDGNLVIGTAGHGIDFSATADSSGTTTSELLDDYEEGTWTPILAGSTTAGTLTGDSAGRYTKIGNQVFLEWRINGVTLSGAVGILQISGLPFAASYGAQNTYSVATVTQMHNFAFTPDSRQSLYPASGGTILYGLESRNSNTWVDWSVTNSSLLYMNANMFYTTSS